VFDLLFGSLYNCNYIFRKKLLQMEGGDIIQGYILGVWFACFSSSSSEVRGEDGDW
jgi:hypothetical protein